LALAPRGRIGDFAMKLQSRSQPLFLRRPASNP
jgi:hypothetical protein